jgi:arylformamidase
MLVTYKDHLFDLHQPIDISIALHEGKQLNCYYAPPFRTEAFIAGDFVGDMKKGGLLNYKNVFLNPHGNGTHTECYAHIADTELTINSALTKFHFLAQLITVQPQVSENGDLIILKKQIEESFNSDVEAARFLCEMGIKHLLIDLPSVDKEEDGGKLAAHHSFWNFPESPRMDATITELIYVPDNVLDGIYLLNLQIASFELDATPSKPVIFKKYDAVSIK